MAKILLVDDSKTLLLHITSMLVAGGHEVTSTSSGHDAVEHLRSGAIELVLTDLYMPQPDGFEIVQAARELSQPPPLIVMSSNSLACDVFRDARELGASATLQKPFSSRELLDTVRHVLALSVGIPPGASRPITPSTEGLPNTALAASA